MAEIGNFFVSIGSKFDSRGFKNARASLNDLGKKVALFGVAFAGAMAFAVKKAIDLEETTAKFNTVFRGVTKDATAMADNLVESYGVSTEESRRFLSGMQDLLVPMGMNRKAASEMSNEIVKLSVDIGSFNNQPTEQVMRDIQSAFNGMPLPMRKYGVNITQARIKQEALNLGLVETGEELTVISKATAVFSLIQKDSADAQGDFARTSDGLANSLKIMKARFDDLVVGIGTKFLPIAKDYVNIIVNDVIPKIRKWTEESGNVEKLVANIAKTVKITTIILFSFAKTVGFTVTAIKVVTERMASWSARIFQVKAAMKGATFEAKLFGKIAVFHAKKSKKQYDKLTESVIETGITIDEMNKLDLESFLLTEEEKQIRKDESNELDIEREQGVQDRKDEQLEAEITRAEELQASKDEQLEADFNRSQAESVIVEEMNARKDESDKKLQKNREIRATRFARVVSDALGNIAHAEALTWASIADSYKKAIIKMIGFLIQQLAAEKVKSLAIALMNSKITFGAASYQIGAVIAAATAGAAGLRALQNFDEGGIVAGRIGQPQLAVVHGGETVIPTSGGGGFTAGNIIINVNQVHSRREADAQARIIGDAIERKVRKTRRI